MHTMRAWVGIAGITAVLLTGCGAAPPAASRPTATSISSSTGAPSVGSATQSPTMAASVTTSVAPPAPTTASSAQATTASSATPEQPIAPEQNPVGDIPDTQAFVPYAATVGGYTLEVPEGWARSTDAANVRFESKLDGLAVMVTSVAAAPTVQSARDHEVAALLAAGRAMTVASIDAVKLPGGSAILVKSTANSNPDPVTNKQVRLEQNIYLFYNNGKLATLTLWAPQGADNVDQWDRIAKSFHWT